MKILKSKLFSFTIGTLLLVVAVTFGSNYFNETEVSLVEIEGDTIADFTDNRNLVGATEHVFLGKVVSTAGQIETHFPISRYNVEVIEEIKGNFEKDQIVIGQYGGYDTDEEGREVLVKFKDEEFLEVNRTYMFAANEQVDGSILIIPVHGHVKVKDDNEKEKVKNQFLEAYKNEKIPDIIKRKMERESTKPE